MNDSKISLNRIGSKFDLKAGEWIIHEGDYGSEMYFISKGKAHAIENSSGKILSKMKVGSFFGEIALLFRCKRTASVRDTKFTELFSLSKEDFDSVLVDYPEYIPKIESIAGERLTDQKLEYHSCKDSKKLLKKRDSKLKQMAINKTLEGREKRSIEKILTLPNREELRGLSREDLLSLNLKVTKFQMELASIILESS
eukprot:TRINITY_DN2104_c0_g1_i1.p1 TRINITY_DN2104_c0_g1~~TRINITY_DN2104_c0_g1_i1.p1  ORF type:complete len:198 (-),score=52.90 TRINITY_DN2104_c0_g1_i1:92-685(-)